MVMVFLTEKPRRIEAAESGAEERGRFLRPVLEDEKREGILDWLVERFEISGSNALAILNHCLHQLQVSCLPTAERLVIERYVEAPMGREESGDGLVHFFFHSLIGRSANDALSRIVALRVKQAVGGNAMVTIDDYGFLLTLKAFQD